MKWETGYVSPWALLHCRCKKEDGTRGKAIAMTGMPLVGNKVGLEGFTGDNLEAERW